MLYVGQGFCMQDDRRILEIKSPKPDRRQPDKPCVTGGPYVVVHKNVEAPQRWAAVAFCWEGYPALGFRWFLGEHGYPNARGHALWMVTPTLLQPSIMEGLSPERSDRLQAFLDGELSGDGLRAFWYNR